MATLIIMMGVPGSGKSTWTAALAEQYDATIVSRDDIRFSIVAENEEYFSKENEVFKTFTDTISWLLSQEVNVIADATHLNYGSRTKLLNALQTKPTFTIVAHKDEKLETCLQRNENRMGTRAYVPESVIRRMFYSQEKPTADECDEYIRVFTGEENDNE
jgi:predicted kinase